MIPFNKPIITGKEKEYIENVLSNGYLSGDGYYTKKCHKWLEKNTKTLKALLTTSGTHALEMAAMLINIKADDEVIMPSYTFTSTANAFILRGARIVFVDIKPDTLNIDEKKIEKALTRKTKAIVPVHYAGVACEMDTIMEIAGRNNLYVVEDAAQAIGAEYKGKALGSIGDLGCYSFHDTKNISCGEGGALLINNGKFFERAEIIREKGTDRSRFYRGEVDKYGWKDIGSSYLPCELSAAFLYAQLKEFELISKKRMDLWNQYYRNLEELMKKELIELPYIPKNAKHNAHMFYIKVKDINQRTEIIQYLHEYGIKAVFHFIPLHTTETSKKHCHFSQKDHFTTKESERILRLPMFYDLTYKDVEYVTKKIIDFFNG